MLNPRLLVRPVMSSLLSGRTVGEIQILMISLERAVMVEGSEL